VNLLLGTQVLVWYDSAPELIFIPAMSAIQDRGNKLFFSTISIWELAIKLSIRKLTQIESLPRIHHDPFDRMLIAQALVEGATLVTADATLNGYPVPTLW